MRKLVVATAAAAAILAVVSFAPNRAEAMTLPAPSGLQLALAGNDLIEQAAYVCRRWCGPRGCWRRCWWRPAPYYYWGPGWGGPGWGGPGPYYYGPRYRRGWW